MNVDVTEQFYDRVRQHFGLSEGSHVDDDHIRMFIYGAVKTALDKAEGDVGT